MSKDIVKDEYTVLWGNSLDRLKELPDNSFDSIVTDPPYGLSDKQDITQILTEWVSGNDAYIPKGKGFMGKEWDAFVPPPAIWKECLRVLKPGGHLLAFFGSRTQDIGMLSIRLAGFEIRDTIMWVYGSGFPKSLDISKQIDKMNGETNRAEKFTAFMRTTGLTAKQINNATNTQMGSHYLTHPTQPAIPTAKIWKLLRPLITIEIPQWVDILVDRIEAERKVIGKKTSSLHNEDVKSRHTIGSSISKVLDITAPALPDAVKWDGWGTALKPANEPIVLARKPLEGTVTNNVLKWSTGGLNIDESRIGSTGGTKDKVKVTNEYKKGYKLDLRKTESTDVIQGRFPSNFIVSHNDDCKDLCSQRCQVQELNNHQDGVAKFFYTPKASKKDRNEGLEKIQTNIHPTVKPTPLMEYLIKLVTLKGGTVLDPFTGSGSTGKAALRNGFKFIGVELTEEYLPIIEGRLDYEIEQKQIKQPTLWEETNE